MFDSCKLLQMPRGAPCQVLALQQGLYGKQLLPRLERLVSEDADFAQLGAVHHTAETHGLVELARSDHGTLGRGRVLTCTL